MSQQTICNNCTRLFKRGIKRHLNVKTGNIKVDREIVCVWRNQPMNNINVKVCNSFKPYTKPVYTERNLIPSNVIEGKSINV